MKQNSGKKRLYLSKCVVCNWPCQHHFNYGVKTCESCKHFFRRSISLMKEYNCKNAGECKDLASCKRCRLYKCLTVGMHAQGVGTSKFNDEQILAFAEQMKDHPGNSAVLNSSPVQKELINLIVMKNLLQIEEKVRRIRYSETPIPEFFYTQCDTFESIFLRKLNLIDMANKFSTKTVQAIPEMYLEKSRQFGPFFIRPAPVVMDLLCVFEIGKTFPFFEKLDNNDKIALCSNIAMPLYALWNSYYSVQQNCDVLCTPDGLMPIKIYANSYYKQDSVAMRMGEKLLRNAVRPFIRLKLNNEEFAQNLLRSEAEKYAALLMSAVQTNYGHAAGALRYVELMGLIEGLFNMGAKQRQMNTYISNVLDPNFDKVFPPVFAKICTKGPVESHQLFPY